MANYWFSDDFQILEPLSLLKHSQQSFVGELDTIEKYDRGKRVFIIFVYPVPSYNNAIILYICMFSSVYRTKINFIILYYLYYYNIRVTTFFLALLMYQLHTVRKYFKNFFAVLRTSQSKQTSSIFFPARTPFSFASKTR